MSNMHIFNILLLIGVFYRTESVKFRIHYCSFECSDSCKSPIDESNPNGVAEAPGAYYWRDFHGIIPPDAYPVGPPTQFPQTFIGLVFDFEHKGLFATTIYDGLNYVYNANEGYTTKIDKPIQILCTKSPGDLAWFKLTKETYTTLSAQGYQVIKAGRHINSEKKPSFHYIVKTNQCHVTYIGVVGGFDNKLEYATIDGGYHTSNDYMWLMYKPKNVSKDSDDKKKKSASTYFSHRYSYQIRPDSIIPKFYKKLTIGSCSITCTNEDLGKIGKFKTDVKLLSSMAYFWQQGGLVDPEISIKAGKNTRGDVKYVGQAGSVAFNLYDVGSGDTRGAMVNYNGGNNDHDTHTFHILGSNYQDKFKWINSTKEDFNKIEKDVLIPGGLFSNGTKTYVCKTFDDGYGNIYPGSLRVLPSGTSCYAIFGPEDKFQVLTFQPPKK